MDTEYEIEWEAPEYEYYPKSILWFWISIIISIIILIIAIWQKNFLFAILIIIGEILILIWGNSKPKILKFKINNNGIHIGDYNFYHFDNIANFSTTKSLMPNLDLIKFNFKNKFKFDILILVPENISNDVKIYLEQKNIFETEYDEHFIDFLQKMFKF